MATDPDGKSGGDAEAMDPSNSHGSPLRTARNPAGVTRTATRRPDGASATEADASFFGRTEFDVGDLCRGHGNLSSTTVVEPQHVSRPGKGSFDTGTKVVSGSVVDLDGDFTGGLGHSDAHVHAPTVSAQARSRVPRRRPAMASPTVAITTR